MSKFGNDLERERMNGMNIAFCDKNRLNTICWPNIAEFSFDDEIKGDCRRIFRRLQNKDENFVIYNYKNKIYVVEVGGKTVYSKKVDPTISGFIL